MGRHYTDDEFRARLWMAYKEGALEHFHTAVRESFERWFAKEFPECNDLSNIPGIENVQEARPTIGPLYWHEYGCRADKSTPHGYLDCVCNGQHPNGLYDHDKVCNANTKVPIGGPMCSCVGRRNEQQGKEGRITKKPLM